MAFAGASKSLLELLIFAIYPTPRKVLSGQPPAAEQTHNKSPYFAVSSYPMLSSHRA